VPVARSEPRRALVAALAVVLAAVLLVLVVLFLNSRGTSSGDGTFGGLDADTFLAQGADEVPVCFDDPVDGLRPICVFHTGDEPDTGWIAYDAQVDGCAFETLSEASTELVDSCTGDTYPFTGEGLAQYEVIVEDGRLAIDLDGSEPTTTTTIAETGDVPQ